MAGAATRRVVLLGAGGAGRAVAHALLTCGVGHVALAVRSPGKVQQLVETLVARHGPGRVSIVDDLAHEVSRADGLVNATPLGMDAHPGLPLDPSLLRPDLWVADLIYAPAETALLRAARAIGARTSSGMGMFIAQAAEQFRLFTGIRPEPERMRRHIVQALAARGS